MTYLIFSEIEFLLYKIQNNYGTLCSWTISSTYLNSQSRMRLIKSIETFRLRFVERVGVEARTTWP